MKETIFCCTVAELIDRLQSYPADTKLFYPTSPVLYNDNERARQSGLEPVLGFEDSVETYREASQ